MNKKPPSRQARGFEENRQDSDQNLLPKICSIPFRFRLLSPAIIVTLAGIVEPLGLVLRFVDEPAQRLTNAAIVAGDGDSTIETAFDHGIEPQVMRCDLCLPVEFLEDLFSWVCFEQDFCFGFFHSVNVSRV